MSSKTRSSTHLENSLFPVSSISIQERTTETHSFRTEAKSFDHVRSSSNSSVDVHIELFEDVGVGLLELVENIDGRRRAGQRKKDERRAVRNVFRVFGVARRDSQIERTTAVIREHDS